MRELRQSDGRGREPILNAPAGVVWAIGVLILIHGALDLMSEDQREWWQGALAFIPARYTANTLDIPGGAGAAIWSFVTHQFIHADWTHLGLNSAWLLAFGGAVASRIGTARFAALGIASGIAGACLFLAFRWGEPTAMAGASGAVSGLMGGAFRFFYSAIDLGGLHLFREAPRAIPRMSLAETFADRRIQFTIGFWVLLNFLTALAAPLLTSAGGIAWEAHLGGFAFGLLAFALFDPPHRRIVPAPTDDFRRTLH